MFNHPYISFFHLLVNSFSVTCFCTFFTDPLPSFNWWAVSVGGEELKWCQLAHHDLMSEQGPHFSPHSKAKAMIKAQISGRMVTSGISHIEFASVFLEKTRLKKCLIMIIMIINEKGDVGMAKCCSKSTETRDELSTTCILNKRCLSVPDATSLHHCLQDHRQYFTILS